jgi:hypothetical protein
MRYNIFIEIRQIKIGELKLMSVSIYFLRRFGLKSKLATTLSEDDLELLDLFLEYNPKLSEKYTPNKQKKLKEYLYNSLETIARIPNVFDELYLLESNGTKLTQIRYINKLIQLVNYQIY